eukprot:TRINITY_DN2066_c0_g1_i5.p1 TRINITY_DN2066_c0_g1~~TRINITY_DN2066_c0_g1_i5.p1  ORF type:complete len:520 (+),score=138.75 TRINITY_DN2066_c0_g1_i5:124-1683(+)
MRGFVLFSAFVCVCLTLSAAVLELPGHRLLHFRRGSDVVVGTSAVPVALDVFYPHGNEQTELQEQLNSLRRKCVAVIDVETLTPEFLSLILDSPSIHAVLVLLPHDEDESSATTALTKIKDIEPVLFWKNIEKPIYATLGNEETRKLLSIPDRLVLEVTASSPQELEGLESTNIAAFLKSRAPQLIPSSVQTPNLAIVSNYDGLSVFPTLPFGVDGPASGVVASLELLRLFSSICNELADCSAFDLAFLFAGAGSVNHQGVEAYLRGTDARLEHSPDASLALDSLFGDVLYLHIAKAIPSSGVIRQLVDALDTVAKSMGITLKKVLVPMDGNNFRRFPHEIFELKQVPAMTLSDDPSGPTFIGGTRVASKNASPSNLMRNIRFVAESLAQLMFSEGNDVIQSHAGNVFGAKTSLLSLRDDYVNQWMDTFEREREFRWVGGSPDRLLRAIEQDARRLVQDVDVSSFELSSDFTFFGEMTPSIRLLKGTSILFDLVLACVVTAYLSGLYLAVRKQWIPILS